VSKTPRLYLCDFGYGIQRYDIGKIAIYEDIGKDGSYKGLRLAGTFDFYMKSFQRLNWIQKVMRFLGWN